VDTEPQYEELSGDEADIDVDKIFSACRSLTINLYNHFMVLGDPLVLFTLAK
jgi:hypothetical protein